MAQYSDEIQGSYTEVSKVNYLKGSLLTLASCYYAELDVPDDWVVCKERIIQDIHWLNVELSENWGCRMLGKSSWNDDEKPFSKMENYNDLQLTEDETNGLLTDRIIAACSSYLVPSPETGEYALCKCNISSKEIKDINALRYWHYLQFVDVSKNQLTTLEPLGQLPFLMYLDASYNYLTEVLDFKAPFNLTYAKFCYNNIRTMSDLSSFWSLVHLDLSFNMIRHIEGLENLKYLKDLNLSHNDIMWLSNLNNLHLRNLNVSHNHIGAFEQGLDVGLHTNHRLKRLNLCQNEIYSLEIIDNCHTLRNINLSHNLISEIPELRYLQKIPNLEKLDLRENPITSEHKFRDTILDYCRNIWILDGEKVTAEAKVLSRKKFETTLFDVNKTSAQHLLLRQINYPNITSSTVPYTDPPVPMIVLVGPPACLKGIIVDICCEIYPKYVIRGVNHTTRPRTEGETDGEQYHFVTYDTFREILRKGLFYSTSEYFGHLYGFARSEAQKVVNSKKVLILHSDLNGALMLRARGLRPTLVLTLPKTERMHRKYLERKYYCRVLDTGLSEVGQSKQKAREGLQKIKKWNQRHMVNELKNILEAIMCSSTGLSPTLQDSQQASSTLETSGSRQFEEIFGKFEKDPSVSEVADKEILEKNVEPTLSKENSSQDISSLKEEEQENEIKKSETESKDTLKKDCSDDAIPVEITQERSGLGKLLDEMIKSRKTYLNMHWANPGLFSYMLYSDELDQMVNSINEILKLCIRTNHLRTPVCQMKFPLKETDLVKERLKELHEMMQPKGTNACAMKKCSQE